MELSEQEIDRQIAELQRSQKPVQVVMPSRPEGYFHAKPEAPDEQ